jgi:hypothetical protein
VSQMAVSRGFQCRALAKQHLARHEHLIRLQRHLTRAGCSVDHGVRRFMKFSAKYLALFCVSSFLVLGQGAHAQDQPASAPKPQDSPVRADIQTRITIEVTGGDKNVPVENASVYVKFIEEHAIKKNKKFELNVKTSREGVAHVPNAPMGRVMVQVIAEGWKTFGRWLDITDPKQTIKVHLERPPKWY